MARRHVRLPIAVRDPAPIVHGKMTPVRVVLHDTESHDTAGLTDIAGIFRFFKTQGEGYGVHFVVDGDGNIGQGGQPTDLQWHVGNLNTGSIGIEQIGFASFTKLVWTRSRRKQLFAVARILAWAHGEYGIPLKVQSNPQSPGITTHARVGAAGIDTSGHTDPGAGYPLGLVVTMAKAIYHLGFADAVRAMPGKGKK
jgi:hypothetical protein